MGWTPRYSYRSKLLHTTPYTNPGFTGTVASAANGKLTIKGLDAGTYYLKETKAPAGFTIDKTVHTVVIEATITETVEGIAVTYKTNTLDSYPKPESVSPPSPAPTQTPGKPPKTGDTSSVEMYEYLALASFCGTCLILTAYRRGRAKQGGEAQV